MKQKTLATIIMLILIATMFAGCNNEPPKPQVVVIDMRAISDVVGIDEKIQKHMKVVNQQIFEEMSALSGKYKKELEDKRASFGNAPSEEDEQKIQTLREQLKKQYAQTQQAVNARRKKERSEILQSFIDGIMPVAQKIAHEHGASIILKFDEGVFWADGYVDITDEVIEGMPSGIDARSVDKEQN